MTENQKLKERVLQLEKELEAYKTDGLEGLYHALNFQLSSLSKELAEEYISFKGKNDKTFERVWKAMVDSKEVAQNLTWLRKELKLESGKEVEKSSTRANPIEMFQKLDSSK